MMSGDDAIPADETVEESLSPQDETRRRFREALDRKRDRRHATDAAAERDGSDKSHGAPGPTKARTFRRKSI